MTSRDGPIDCDIHPAVPGIKSLLPYLPGHWAEAAVDQGFVDMEPALYPVNSPITARPDWRPKTGSGKAGADLTQVREQALDAFGSTIAICNCVYGVHLLFNRDMAAAFATAVNDWIAHEWLAKEPRLRASIVVPLQAPDRATEEVERLAPDRRFVQVLMPVSAEMPLGKPFYWPIYAAAERHGLPIGIHAGTMSRHPTTALGWPSYQTEDYIAQAQAFQTATASLVAEGVFVKFPDLKVVYLESGFTWLPACLWRMDKYWKGLRKEIPWVDRPPTEIVRDHVRLTLQPIDAPPDGDVLERLFDQLGSDELLLYSTDYPHWQFDGTDVLPTSLSRSLARKIQIDNPRATYRKLRETEHERRTSA
jgi:predicted TIM-barrel fold metal-dependent hydrolase